jgi:hypothetical protein
MCSEIGIAYGTDGNMIYEYIVGQVKVKTEPGILIRVMSVL